MMIEKILILVLLISSVSAFSVERKCINIYYDKVTNLNKPYYFGRIHALMLQNLMGHFPEWQQIVTPISKYQAGDLDRCQANIYLGTYFENNVPEDFLHDYYLTKNNVAWAGYNVWLLGEDKLKSLWGVRYNSLSVLDEKNIDAKNGPSFYRYYEYKGEVFEKYGAFDKKDPKKYWAAFEITLFDQLDNFEPSTVKSWARHSFTGQKTPYILQKNNHWYIGDSPFTFMTEEDRYLIFADILFDILNETPRYSGKKPAVFRVEDVHAEIPEWQLYGMVDLLNQQNIPFAMSMIPMFVDPFGVAMENPENRFSLMDQKIGFKKFIDYTKERSDVSFIYHGVTHQSGEMINMFNGLSGDDFEFWNRVKNIPMASDSPAWVVNRLEDGLSILHNTGISPIAWLTPHYQASPLDYTLFGQLFNWNVGRIIYFPTELSQQRKLPESWAMDRAGVSKNGQRLDYLADVVVQYAHELFPNGQFFPYEIYGDTYGQRLIPENVGNVQPYMNEQVYQTQTVDDLIRILKRNRVLRDNWGSFFIHPFRLDARENEGIGAFPGDTKEMVRLIQAVKRFGYEFINLKNFTTNNRHLMRPEPEEIY